MPATKPLPRRIAVTLHDCARAVADAERELGRARDRLHSAVYDAVRGHDCQAAAVAEAANLSRETVHKIIGRA
jgi:hypothetical protein